MAFAFLPEEFTLPQLQRIYEILLGKELYKANFRKKIKDLVEETEHYTTGVSHRPSQYYRRKGNGEETGKMNRWKAFLKAETADWKNGRLSGWFWQQESLSFFLGTGEMMQEESQPP